MSVCHKMQNQRKFTITLSYSPDSPLGYVHTNTDGRRRTFFHPSVAVVAFIPTRTAPDGRTEKNGEYKETEADVVVVVETKGEQGALYPHIFCAPC